MVEDWFLHERLAEFSSVDVRKNQKKVVLFYIKRLLFPISAASDFFSVIALIVITDLLGRWIFLRRLTAHS
jgi:hypothetical protein